jgi:hypothetical protein
MSYSFNGTQSTYLDPNTSSMKPEDQQKIMQMEKVKNESVDAMLWAQSQNMALSKIKLYHTLAKEIYGQQ